MTTEQETEKRHTRPQRITIAGIEPEAGESLRILATRGYPSEVTMSKHPKEDAYGVSGSRATSTNFMLNGLQMYLERHGIAFNAETTEKEGISYTAYVEVVGEENIDKLVALSTEKALERT